MRTLVTTFGRMNPPTNSHIQMIKTMIDIATIKSGNIKVYLSETWDEKKNPLTIQDKTKIIYNTLSDKLPAYSIDKAKDVLDVLKLNDTMYDKIIFVCGSDRKEEYRILLNKYNGNLYSFKEIVVYGISRKDGISATLARKMACQGNYKEFSEIVPEFDRDKVYSKIRSICCPYDVMMEDGQNYLNNINTPECEKWILKKY